MKTFADILALVVRILSTVLPVLMSLISLRSAVTMKFNVTISEHIAHILLAQYPDI